MKEIVIKNENIIEQALSILEKDTGLTKSTLLVVASRSYKPMENAIFLFYCCR